MNKSKGVNNVNVNMKGHNGGSDKISTLLLLLFL